MSEHIAKQAVLAGGVTYSKGEIIPDDALTDEQWMRLSRMGAIETRPCGDEDDDDLDPEDDDLDPEDIDLDPEDDDLGPEDDDPNLEDSIPDPEDDPHGPEEGPEEGEKSEQAGETLMESLNVTGEGTVVDGQPAGRPARSKKGAKANASETAGQLPGGQ